VNAASAARHVPPPGSRAHTDGAGGPGAEPYRGQGRPQRQRRRQPERRARPKRQNQHEPVLPSLAHPVIAGYDGSTTARNALAYAAGMAKRLRRPLLVVYVTTPGLHFAPLTGQVVGLPGDTEALERWLRAELDQVADPAGLDVHLRTRPGHPARELAVVAAELSADALVIGAPAHFWHHVAGSVPGWLARHARCPVVVVP
jgi:nucleotide-binding universal stress UspA family protein